MNNNRKTEIFWLILGFTFTGYATFRMVTSSGHSGWIVYIFALTALCLYFLRRKKRRRFLQNHSSNM